MILYLSVLILFSIAIRSDGKVWEENPKSPQDLSIVRRFQYIPPRKTTARKLAKYFLVQGEALRWEALKKLEKRPKRQAELLPYDVLFIVDSSGSIPRTEFPRGISALKGIIPRARPDTVYASITFSNNASLDFPFISGNDASKRLAKLVHEKGLTNTQAALELARVKVFNYSSGITGLRRKSSKRILIVTDGQSNVAKTKTLYQAHLLKQRGVEVFVIAVGNHLRGIREIVNLASSSDAHLYRVRSNNELHEVVKLIPKWRNLRQKQNRLWLNSMSSFKGQEF